MNSTTYLLSRDDGCDWEINGSAGAVGEGENFGEGFDAEFDRGLRRRQDQSGCAVVKFRSVGRSDCAVFLEDGLETGDFTEERKKRTGRLIEIQWSGRRNMVSEGKKCKNLGPRRNTLFYINILLLNLN